MRGVFGFGKPPAEHQFTSSGVATARRELRIGHFSERDELELSQIEEILPVGPPGRSKKKRIGLHPNAVKRAGPKVRLQHVADSERRDDSYGAQVSYIDRTLGKCSHDF